MDRSELEYVGFWPRVGASLIDNILLTIITAPFLVDIYGQENMDSMFKEDHIAFQHAVITGALTNILISGVFPAIVILFFWIYRQASPGKMVFSAKIMDATTGNPPSTKQCIIRYLGYFASIFALGIGFIWIAFDPRKQGWHDKMANTVVVRRVKHPAFEADISGQAQIVER